MTYTARRPRTRSIGIHMARFVLFIACLLCIQGVSADTAPSPDGIPIVYEVHGAGEPTLVFIHGWSCDRTYWKPQLEAFSKKHKVIAIDLAGHGESGAGKREEWTMAAFGGDVAAVLEKLDVKGAVLIGHSMGADVVTEAALRAPGRVTGLVWLDQYNQLGTPRDPKQVEQFMANIRANFPETTQKFVRGMFPPTAEPKLVDKVAADMSSAPPEIAVDALHETLINEPNVREALAELKVPVITINPASAPIDEASLKKHGVEVIRMPGVGHFLMMENPAGFNLLLAQAIERIGR
jgi:pimeloyl-ACP methyl ester carboxylesterase